MTRREIIKRTALISGYALSASVIQGILSGCQAEGQPEWVPQFFSEEQGRWLAEMGETILPQTADSPGAKDVSVHEFIDLMVNHIFIPKDKENFKAGLDALNQRAMAAYGKAVDQISADQRLEFLNKEDAQAKTELEALEANPPAVVEGEAPYDKRPFFIQFKQLVIAGYFTSEKVGTEVLAFDPIPGEFNGCIPLSDVGKAWAI